MVNKIKETYKKVGQYLGAAKFTPSKSQIQRVLFTFIFVIALFTVGMFLDIRVKGLTPYNDTWLAHALNPLIEYLQRSLGGKLMVVGGIGAILSSAFGKNRPVLGLLLIAIMGVIIRTVEQNYFNDTTLYHTYEGWH